MAKKVVGNFVLKTQPQSKNKNVDVAVIPLIKYSEQLKIGLSRSLQLDKVSPIKETKSVIPLKEDMVKESAI